MDQPGTMLEYGRPPRRRRWRLVLVSLALVAVLVGGWRYQKRVRGYVADAYADWQFRRAFDRAWNELPTTDGVWLAPPDAAAQSANPEQLLAPLLGHVYGPPSTSLLPTRVLFVRATDEPGRRWLSFACISIHGPEIYRFDRGERRAPSTWKWWRTPTLSPRPPVNFALQEITRHGQNIETTIDIDGGRNVLSWEVSKAPTTPDFTIAPLTGLTTFRDWWPNTREWTLTEGPAPARQIRSTSGSFAIAFLPDGRIAQATPEIVIVDPASTTQPDTFEIPPHVKRVDTFAFSPDGTKLFVGQFNDRTWLVDVNSGRFDALAGSPSGTSRAAFADDRTLIVVDDVSRTRVDVTTRRSEPLSFVDSGDYFGFGAAGERLAIPCMGKVKLVDLRSGRPLREFPPIDETYQMSLSPDARVVAIKGQRGLRLYDAGSGAIILDHDLDTDLQTPRARIKWSADGLRGATAGEKYAYVWSLREPRRLVRFAHKKVGSWQDVALSSDGKQMAVSGNDTVMISYWPDIDAVMEGTFTSPAPSPR